MKRSFSKEFKRKVVEEWVAGQIGPAQLYRKYEISPGLLYNWKRQYGRGKYDNEPTSEVIIGRPDQRVGADGRPVNHRE
jgi:transposase